MGGTGWRRVRAGVEPRFTTYAGDPVAFILGANVHRRHLSQGQKAMALAKAQTFSSGKFQRKGEVAKDLGLGGSHLSRAITVLTYAPDLVDAVLSGETQLTAAYTVARQRKDPDVLLATLELSRITLDRRFRQRPGDPEAIAAYRRAYRRGEQLPPLNIVNIGGALCLVDGWMRYEALVQIGAETTSCRITQGTIADAYGAAAIANAKHGLPLTVADKRWHVFMGLSARLRDG